MTTNITTLDSLLLDQQKKETNNIAIHKNNSNNKKKKERPPPPPIPPSPTTKHDETLQTDLLLRKFELDAANETWQENTLKRPEFNNTSFMQQQIEKFGLNLHKYQYQTFIKHTKTKISDLIDDGASIHIVRQFSDVGCPTIKNPNSKRGCWCIDEIKKQKKNYKIVPKIKPTAIHSTNHHLMLSTNIAMNQKAQTLMDNFRKFGVQNPATRTTFRLNSINAKPPTKNAVDVIQNNLILNARTQHYMPSNRMQQIRMQQMLLNARTNNNHPTKKDTVLGARKHKDTIVFSNDSNSSNNSNGPPMKRRKKSRWSTTK